MKQYKLYTKHKPYFNESVFQKKHNSWSLEEHKQIYTGLHKPTVTSIFHFSSLHLPITHLIASNQILPY